MQVIERLPQYAELYFATLCASGGVICNKADQDERGWDWFLEFPTRRSPRQPADMQPAGPEAMVQVKSTSAAPFTTRMKLSNAFHFAQARQPCFIVLVVATTGTPAVYARHFWETEIARTLKRIRLAEHDGDARFNRRHIDFRMSEADLKADVIAWMRDTIEAVKPNYASEKARIACSVGHEDGYGSLDVTFEGDPNDFLDLQLGLIESLPVLRGRYAPQRFGIEAQPRTIETEGSRLFIDAKPTPARLRLQGGSPTEALLVDADFYSAQLPGNDHTLHRWRVDAGPLRISGGNGKYSAALSMRAETRRPVTELTLFLTLANWHGKGPVGLELFVDNKRAPLGVLNIDPVDGGDQWTDLRTWAKALEAVALAALVPAADVSISDLCNASPWLERFAGFVGSASIRIDSPLQATDNPVRAIAYHAVCDIGDWCFAAIVERNTKNVEIDSTTCRVSFGAPQLLDAFVQRGNCREMRDDLETAYQAHVDRLGMPETLWNIGDVETFISHGCARHGD